MTENVTTNSSNNSTTATQEELREQACHLLIKYLEARGLEVLRPSGWHGCDCVAYDPTKQETILVNLSAKVVSEDDVSLPALDVDMLQLLLAEALTHEYAEAYPDVKSIRFDFVSIAMTSERSARLRHLVGAYEWEV